MMKSLSRLFGGKKSTEEPQTPAASASPAATKPKAPKPASPVEVLVADDDARRAKSRRPEADANVRAEDDPNFDTETPLTIDPVRHRGGGPQDDAIDDDDRIAIDHEPIAATPAPSSVPMTASTTAERDPEPEDDDFSMSLSTRRGKQEMLNQLRRNYDEVLGIVRKVDQHLDDQARRSERMLEIAEQTSRHLENLGPMNENTARMAEAMTQLIEITRTGNDSAAATGAELMKAASNQLEQQREQTSTLREVKTSIDAVGEHDREMADSIKGFTDTIGGVKTATNELGTAITAMRENDAERERELAQIVSRSQRWLIATVVVVGVVAVGALAAVLMAALN